MKLMRNVLLSVMKIINFDEIPIIKMKKLLSIVICLLAILPFGTAWGVSGKSFPVKSPEGNVQVLYLVDNGSSVSLLCRYCPNLTEVTFPVAMDISGKTRIVTEDGGYSLLKSYQLPFRDEAEPKFAYIKASRPELNFVLEFEKFPFDEPFDLVEGTDDASSIILRGLTVDKGKTESVSAQEFLAHTPYSEYRYFYKDGSPVYCFDDESVYFASTSCLYNSSDDYYLDLYFKIVNRTQAPFTVRLSDISASAMRYNNKHKKVKCNLTLLDAKKADKEWLSLDVAEVINEVPRNAGNFVADAAANAALSPGMDPFGSLGLFALGAIVGVASTPDLEPYLKDRNAERERLMKLYLSESTIAPGDTLATFATIKYKGIDIASTTVSVNVNGETYTLQY